MDKLINLNSEGNIESFESSINSTLSVELVEGSINSLMTEAVVI